MLAQILDVDYFFNGKTVVRIFCKTQKANTICLFYDEFLPYFYAIIDESKIDQLKDIKEIKNLEWTEKFIPLGYQKEKTKMLKITLNNPQDVPVVRDKILQEDIAKNVFEADILFKYRFMIDYELKGMDWVDFEGEKINTTMVSVPAYYVKNIKKVERNENIKTRHISYDIECIPLDFSRPLDSKKDPIVMIAIQFEPEYREKKSLVLVAKPTIAKDAKGFQNEKEMLQDFIKIVEEFDPDVISGYNANGFDFPYLIERMKKNGLPLNWGRCKDKSVYSKTFGISQETIVPGRVVADPYQILKRDPWVKFSRYNLNTIAKIMLNEEKLDVSYKEMPSLWNGTKEDIGKFVEYCRKDAELSLRLITEKGLLDKFFELSKLSGVLLQDCFGGQSTRVETMILHEFKNNDYVMPSKPSKTDLVKRAEERDKRGLKGAVVLEPKKGLHAEGCILVLDFRSLYPSIMRTFNISPDTLLINNDSDSFNLSPLNTKFITQDKHDGVVPKILSKLIEIRANIKKEMKASTDSEAKRILNAKQLAVKDMSNSFYGYVGYARARLYMIDVASAVTAFGRDNIEKTKKLIEEKYNLTVVYGDTDSIFLKTDITNLEEAKKLGDDISKYITDQLPGYLELAFEKIYRTFMILTKKRYAGWKFEYTENGWKDKIDMKGIETVRRDWCPLVSETMNTVINIILKEGDIQKAIDIVKNILEKLKKNEIPLEKLAIVKGITKNLDGYEGMLPHIELARKLAKRNPQDAPKIGDRVGFVIIKGNSILSKRAEDPDYIKSNNISIDPDYYINCQLLPPIERIFSSMGIEKTELLGGGRQVSLGDLFTNKKRTMKHDISIDYTKKEDLILKGCEEFICKKCNKSYRRMSLTGLCECGGEILIGFQGSMGNKMVVS